MIMSLDKTIILTGGAGFIGSAVLARLNERGISNIIVVDDLAKSAKWKNLVGKQFIDYVHKDDFLEALVRGAIDSEISSIIHMGACSSTTEEDADYLMENNYRYSRILLEVCHQRDIRFVYASSAATYGDGERGFDDAEDHLQTLRPLNRYGFSKQMFDLWLLRNGYLATCAGLKFFNVYGPNEYHKGSMVSMVRRAFEQVTTDGVIRLFRSYRDDFADGDQKRDFIYVKDCVDTILWLCEHREVNGIFNCGSGEARSWNDLAQAVFSALETKPKIEYISMPSALRDQYQYFTQANLSKGIAQGVPAPQYSLEDGVRDYVERYLASGLSYY